MVKFIILYDACTIILFILLLFLQGITVETLLTDTLLILTPRY